MYFISSACLRHFSKNTGVLQTGSSIRTGLSAKQRSFSPHFRSVESIALSREICLRYFSVYLMFNEVACCIHLTYSQPISVRSMLIIN